MKHERMEPEKSTHIPLSMCAAHAVGFRLVTLKEVSDGCKSQATAVDYTLIFLTRQVKHPVLLRVYFGRFL